MKNRNKITYKKNLLIAYLFAFLLPLFFFDFIQGQFFIKEAQAILCRKTLPILGANGEEGGMVSGGGCGGGGTTHTPTPNPTPPPPSDPNTYLYFENIYLRTDTIPEIYGDINGVIDDISMGSESAKNIWTDIVGFPEDVWKVNSINALPNNPQQTNQIYFAPLGPTVLGHVLFTANESPPDQNQNTRFHLVLNTDKPWITSNWYCGSGDGSVPVPQCDPGNNYLYLYNDHFPLRSTTLHEMGHAMGLTHTENNNSIMNTTYSGLIGTDTWLTTTALPSLEDGEWVRQIYNLPDRPIEYINASFPPAGSIDARQPHPPHEYNNVQGWDKVWLMVLGDGRNLTSNDFEVFEESLLNDDETSLAIAEVFPIFPNDPNSPIQITLAHPIRPYRWTVIRHIASNNQIAIGFLPTDFNGNGISSSTDYPDWIFLENMLNNGNREVYPTQTFQDWLNWHVAQQENNPNTLADYQIDVNRDGTTWATAMDLPWWTLNYDYMTFWDLVWNSLMYPGYVGFMPEPTYFLPEDPTYP